MNHACFREDKDFSKMCDLVAILLFCVTSSEAWKVYPRMMGEQLDLMGDWNKTFEEWPKTMRQEGFPDASANSSSLPPSTIERDREPLDEVEQIEPRNYHIKPERSPPAPVTTELPFPRIPFDPSVLAQRHPPPQRFPPPESPPPTASIDEVFCDFGSFPTATLCEWQNGNGGLKWIAGTGMTTNWIGGPPSDFTSGTMEGGYAFMETSQLPLKDEKYRSPGGLLHSAQLGSTGVSGTCIMFKYNIDGLSVGGLRVILHLGVDHDSIKKESNEEITPDNATATGCQPTDIFDERPIWNAQYYIPEVWQPAQILYTYPELHSLIIEGIPVDHSDQSRVYEGYIAIDDLDLQPGTSCLGFCNFAGGFCDYNNDAEDDFDWTISRGSRNPMTGPTVDSSSDRSTAGGYAYIDSSFPRRPGDKAKLFSTSFPATEAPICLHFWFHMFGSGIGTLKVFLRHFRSNDAPLRELWNLAGNVGNAWFAAQLTIGSLDDYQLVFEASVGNTGIGDIAIDDISFVPGACPVLPQVAAPISRDCTFEIDECEWINSRDPDRVEWERIASQTLSPRNQRRPYSNGYTINHRNDYFLNLGRPRGGPRSSAGGTAQLVSRQMKSSDEPLCITFWYFMFEPFVDSSGPSLGVLRVSLQLLGDSSSEHIPIWQLYNNQGPTWNYAQASVRAPRDFAVIFEGSWGPNRASGSIAIDDIAFYSGNCTVRPLSATVRPEDCSFEKGLCGWENITLSEKERAVTWQRAFLAHRPAQLLDKTFGATGDFVFFDIFTNNQKSTDVELRSPVIPTSPDEESVCFTFWFAAFGVEESTSLQVIKVPADEAANTEEDEGSQETGLLWSLTAQGFSNPRPVWTAAQLTVEARTPYRLILKGSASNGGFAIDDIKFQPRACPLRPLAAYPPTNGS